jgi:hypothetical protein
MRTKLPITLPKTLRKPEAEYVDGWVRNVLADAFNLYPTVFVEGCL